MSARAVPFYCPYCGEEDIVPEPAPDGVGEGHGHWACRACRRAFRLSLTALMTANPGEPAGELATRTTARRTGSANGTTVAPSDGRVEEKD